MSMGFVKDEGEGARKQMPSKKRGQHVWSDKKTLWMYWLWSSCSYLPPKRVPMHARSCKFKVSSVKSPSQCKAAETRTSLRTVALIMAPFLLCFLCPKWLDCWPTYYYYNHGYWADKLCTLSLNYCLCHGGTWLMLDRKYKNLTGTNDANFDRRVGKEKSFIVVVDCVGCFINEGKNHQWCSWLRRGQQLNHSLISQNLFFFGSISP